MTITKGDHFHSSYSNQAYVVVGKWCGNMVLAPTTPDNDECLIYSASEIKELLTKFELVREARCK